MVFGWSTEVARAVVLAGGVGTAFALAIAVQFAVVACRMENLLKHV